MLIRFDPFRELDRLTEQLASTATRVPRGFPMRARSWRCTIVAADVLDTTRPGAPPGGRLRRCLR
jgi:hypothetical protein